MTGTLPMQVTLTGPSAAIFQQAAYLATLGYTFTEWQMDQAIPSFSAVLVMILGEVDDADITAAEQAIGRSLAMELA